MKRVHYKYKTKEKEKEGPHQCVMNTHLRFAVPRKEKSR